MMVYEKIQLNEDEFEAIYTGLIVHLGELAAEADVKSLVKTTLSLHSQLRNPRYILSDRE